MADRRDIERLADDILLLIRTNEIQSFSRKSLAEECSAKPSDISKALDQIEQWNYQIERDDDGRTVRFLSAPDSLTATEISYKLQTEVLGRQIFSYQSVKSTNEIAMRMAENGAVEGTIVTAEEQTSGRGRLGREWHSPRGVGIYLSIILRPLFPPDKAPGISLVAALALADVISLYLPNMVKIKWPNDVLINGRKTAGILTELAADKDRIEHLIVGVGINVNQEMNDFPSELRPRATSIREALRNNNLIGDQTDSTGDRVRLLQQFLAAFENEYLQYKKTSLESSLPRIRSYSSLIGRQVRLMSANEQIEGKAVDINLNGALEVEIDGRLTSFSSGEVTVLSAGQT